MAYKVIRTEYKNDIKSSVVLKGEYNTYDEADCAINDDISEFREHTDNDERIDWNIVEVSDDIGNCTRFEWSIEEI